MRLIDKISPKKLKELYWERNMSSPDIAKIYNCHQTTIQRRLKKYGVRTRTASEARINFGGVKISKGKLKKLYLDKKMTASEIAKNFNCCQKTVLNKLLEYQIPIRTISEASVLIKPRYLRKNFSGNLAEKAYLIGFRIGDLSVSSESENSSTIYVRVSSTKIEFIRLMKRLFSPYGHVWNKLNKKQINVKCYLDKSFDFLLDKKDSIDSWILKNRKYFAAFLAGYSDAEGCFCIWNHDKNSIFQIISQDKNILFQIHSKLNGLGILCRPPFLSRKKGVVRKGIINNKDEWTIAVRRKESLLKLIKLIDPYLKHLERRKNMAAVKENALWRNEQYNHRQSHRWDKLYLNESVKI